MEYVNKKYGEGTVEVNVKDQYFNMIEKIRPHMHLVDNVKKVMEELGVTPIDSPIRGGTDGARIAQMLDIPCPNIYAGGHNMHSVYEWAALDAMNDATKLLLGIVKQWAK